MRRPAKTQVRKAGLDGFYTQLKGKDRALMVLLDMGNGQPGEIAEVAEASPDKLMAWLMPLNQQYGVEVIFTDDLFNYPVVANELDLKRQVCRFHTQRWMMLTLKECETLGRSLVRYH